MALLEHEVIIANEKIKQFKKVEREGSFARLNGSTDFPVPTTGMHAWLSWRTESQGGVAV